VAPPRQKALSRDQSAGASLGGARAVAYNARIEPPHFAEIPMTRTHITHLPAPLPARVRAGSGDSRMRRAGSLKRGIVVPH
jgi:hypothetical protein